MFTKTQILAFALSLASAEAASKGFNYGNNKPDGSLKAQADFQSEFHTAKNLEGTSGFNSARLYTMIVSISALLLRTKAMSDPRLAR